MINEQLKLMLIELIQVQDPQEKPAVLLKKDLSDLIFLALDKNIDHFRELYLPGEIKGSSPGIDRSTLGRGESNARAVDKAKELLKKKFFLIEYNWNNISNDDRTALISLNYNNAKWKKFLFFYSENRILIRYPDSQGNYIDWDDLTVQQKRTIKTFFYPFFLNITGFFDDEWPNDNLNLLDDDDDILMKYCDKKNKKYKSIFYGDYDEDDEDEDQDDDEDEDEDDEEDEAAEPQEGFKDDDIAKKIWNGIYGAEEGEEYDLDRNFIKYSPIFERDWIEQNKKKAETLGFNEYAFSKDWYDPGLYGTSQTNMGLRITSFNNGEYKDRNIGTFPFTRVKMKNRRTDRINELLEELNIDTNVYDALKYKKLQLSYKTNFSLGRQQYEDIFVNNIYSENSEKLILHAHGKTIDNFFKVPHNISIYFYENLSNIVRYNSDEVNEDMEHLKFLYTYMLNMNNINSIYHGDNICPDLTLEPYDSDQNFFNLSCIYKTNRKLCIKKYGLMNIDDIKQIVENEPLDEEKLKNIYEKHRIPVLCKTDNSFGDNTLLKEEASSPKDWARVYHTKVEGEDGMLSLSEFLEKTVDNNGSNANKTTIEQLHNKKYYLIDTYLRFISRLKKELLMYGIDTDVSDDSVIKIDGDDISSKDFVKDMIKENLDIIHGEYINNMQIIEACLSSKSCCSDFCLKTPEAAPPSSSLLSADVEISLPTTLSELLDLEQILFKTKRNLIDIYLTQGPNLIKSFNCSYYNYNNILDTRKISDAIPRSEPSSAEEGKMKLSEVILKLSNHQPEKHIIVFVESCRGIDPNGLLRKIEDCGHTGIKDSSLERMASLSKWKINDAAPTDRLPFTKQNIITELSKAAATAHPKDVDNINELSTKISSKDNYSYEELCELMRYLTIHSDNKEKKLLFKTKEPEKIYKL